MIVHHVQGSPAWFEWRLAGIGGSDAAVILDAADRRPGAVRDLNALLGAKLAPLPPDGRYPESFRQRGPSAAIQELERRTGQALHPACVQHDELPWLRATLDGLTFLGDALAKCGPRRISDHEAALAGEVPEPWSVQVQHCLLASGAELAWYVSYTQARRFTPEERFAVVEVWPDAELMARLADAEERFWLRLCAARGAAVRATA